MTRDGNNMVAFNYDDFYEKIGRENGWDFSDINVTSEGMTWRFYDEVKRICKPENIILDIGTGGGEAVLDIASSVTLVIGIDLSSGMIETARRNVLNSNVSNTRFIQMNAEKLQFPNRFFDVVSSHHSPFNPQEVARVLNDQGTFLTQQVSEDDKLNIKTFFNRGQSYGEKDGTLKENYVDALNNAGFSEVKVFDYDATEYYSRPEDLIFLLTHTPIIPDFGETNADFEMLEKFIQKNETEKGIMTNSKRFMIVANM